MATEDATLRLRVSPIMSKCIRREHAVLRRPEWQSGCGAIEVASPLPAVSQQPGREPSEDTHRLFKDRERIVGRRYPERRIERSAV